jgi:hypothetical protein
LALRADQGHEHRDAERAADLTRGLVHRTPDSKAWRGERRHCRGAEHREGEADPDADDQRPWQPCAEVVRCRRHSHDEEDQSGGEARSAEEQDAPEADAGRELAGETGDHCNDQRTGRDGKPCRHDRVVPDAREEEDVAEQHCEEAGGVHDGGGVGDDECSLAEQVGVDHRSRVMHRTVDKRGAGQQRDTERAEDAGVRPSPGRTL